MDSDYSLSSSKITTRDTLSNKKSKILDQLIKHIHSTDSKNTRSYHCAVVVQNGKILSYGINKNRSLLKRCCLTSVHAEIDALYNYNNNHHAHSQRLSLWVIRLNKKCELRNSMPCNACMNAIKKFNIRKIVYSTSNGTLMELKLNEFHLIGYDSLTQQRFPELSRSWSIF